MAVSGFAEGNTITTIGQPTPLMLISEDPKLPKPKTNFWRVPLLSIGCFFLLSCGYACLIFGALFYFSFGIFQISDWRFAGFELHGDYGSAFAFHLLGIAVTAGLLSAATILVLSRSAPKALSALRKNRTET